MDTLEVYRKVIKYDEVCAAKEEHKDVNIREHNDSELLFPTRLDRLGAKLDLDRGLQDVQQSLHIPCGRSPILRRPQG